MGWMAKKAFNFDDLARGIAGAVAGPAGGQLNKLPPVGAGSAITPWGRMLERARTRTSPYTPLPIPKDMPRLEDLPGLKGLLQPDTSHQIEISNPRGTTYINDHTQQPQLKVPPAVSPFKQQPRPYGI